MKVLFDHQTFSMQKYGGISRYFCELISKLKEMNPEDSYKVGVLFSNNVHLEDSGLVSSMPFFRNYKFRGQFRLNEFMYDINSSYSKFLIKNFDVNILHATYYDSYFENLVKKKHTHLVATFHDMTNEILKNEFSELNHQPTMDKKRRMFELADRVIAISEHTKKDIIECYNITEDKISVIHHGFTIFNSENYESINKKVTLPKRYLLFVGQRIIYKNFTRFFKAIAPLLKEYSDLHLICAGGDSFCKEEIDLFAEYKLSGKVKFFDIPNDNRLKYLYSNALAFIFPSLYEGFGIPILESFYCKCPVVLANESCFPEIAADAALYFDPRSEDSIYCSIKELINNPNLGEQLKIKGINRLTRFTWVNASKKTYEVYKSLL